MSERLLITGFDAIAPTAGTLDNPAAILAVQAHEEFRDQGVVGAILPTRYADCGERVNQLISEIQPQTMLMLGQAATRYIRLETGANNQDISPRLDNDGYRSSGIIIPDGPERFAVTLPVHDLFNTLTEAGLPVELSEDAGGYLCNHALAKALHQINQAKLPTRCGFMHVPSREAVSDTPDAWGPSGWVYRGVRVAVQKLLES